MLTIRKAAALTGVPEHTLRAWERRYDLLHPARTPSGYRVYDEAEVARIAEMHRLVQAGWTPRAAAAEVALERTNQDGPDPYAELVEAAAALDAEAVSRVVIDHFSRAPFESVVDHWLMPALVEVGRAWAAGEVSVAGEHLVANVVTRRMYVTYDATPQRRGDRPVLIGAPPAVDHQLGLLAFAVAASRAGLPTVYLGAQVPLDAWTDAAARMRPRSAVIAVPRKRDATSAARVVEALSAEPSVPVWVGGRYQHLVGDPERRLGHAIGPAAARLAEEDA